MTPIQITIPTIFAVAAIAMCFFKRLPACLVAFAAYVAAGLLGVINVPIEQYLIWGFISLADTFNIYASELKPTRAMRLYTVVGCFVGCLLGTVAGSIAAVLVAGALGAIMGFLAFTRTPQGRSNPQPLSRRLSLFADTACTAWFTFALSAVVLAAVFA